MGQGKNWTAEECELLAEYWGVYSIGTIAKRMNRSENAVMEKASRLGLGAHLQSSTWIPLIQLLREFGADGGYSERIKKLEAAGMKIRKQRVRNSSFRMVDIDEFWQFAEKNRRMFDFSKLEKNALGEEPPWVAARRTADWRRGTKIKPNKTKWTEAEDRELLRLLREYRYTVTEIGARLHRTEGAVQRRMQSLGVKYRPLKADNHTAWTEEQLAIVCEMIKSGSNYEDISHAVGKGTKAIRGRVYAMYLTENLDKAAALIGGGRWGDNRPDRTLSQRYVMTLEEKKQTKEEISKLAGLLALRIRKQFDDQDNWQRNLCQNWDEVKGCTAGGVNCDDCSEFVRIRPQNCARCGATFYERKENRICERCRVQRKKQAAHKYLLAKERRTKKGDQENADL